MAITITPLDKAHDVRGFASTSDVLNRWLQTIASQHQGKSLSKTFVMVDTERPRVILGYYALAIRQMMPREDLPATMRKRLPLSIPGFTLARLAVSTDAAGQGFGGELLVHAIDRATDASERVGGPFLFVDAKDAQAARFYEHFGFHPFPGDPLTLVMGIGSQKA